MKSQLIFDSSDIKDFLCRIKTRNYQAFLKRGDMYLEIIFSDI